MKKIIPFLFTLFFSLSLSAQNEATKFLGIPVDGTKSAMIQKLQAKGFRYNSTLDRLNGEFNGTDVSLSILTNNKKVWRKDWLGINACAAFVSTQTSQGSFSFTHSRT